MRRSGTVRTALFLSLIITVSYLSDRQALAGGFASEGPGIAAEGWEKTRRAEAWLIAPIPEAVLGGLMTVDAAFTEETSRSAPSPSFRQVLKTGLIWHPHHKEGAPRYYLAAARTGLADERKTIRPMISGTIGTRIIDDDLPFRLGFSPTDVTLTQIFVTALRFPGHTRFKGGIAHRIRMKNGLIIDLRIPDRAQFGFAAADDDWRLFTGWEKEDEFFPLTVGPERGWGEESTERRQIGGRLRLHGPLFLVLQAGERRLKSTPFAYDGHQLDAPREEKSSFVRLAVESWISVL
jgi:hypothetical protein